MKTFEDEVDALSGRTLFIPQMYSGSGHLLCAAFRALGVDARPSPDSDARTRELAAKYCNGDECYPQIVALGDFLKIVELPDFEPDKAAFFLPQTAGPCRFGQYHVLFKSVLKRLGLEETYVVSPSCEDGYKGLGRNGPEIMHYLWWAIVTGDLLLKSLHRTRPYERKAGMSDAVYAECISDASATIARREYRGKTKYADLRKCLSRCLARFAAVDLEQRGHRLLIGVSGEIFCRLNTFVNEDLVRKIEKSGGEVWITDVAEWVNYCNLWEMEEIRSFGNRYSTRMLNAWLVDRAQRKEEHEMAAIFSELCAGKEEPESVSEIVELGTRYLEPHAGLGEMILNLGRAVWLHRKGADGMIDISPFSCMNGIISESIYPNVSDDLDGMPIRTFYFDGTQSNLDEDVAIFMEMATYYSHNKNSRRAVK